MFPISGGMVPLHKKESKSRDIVYAPRHSYLNSLLNIWKLYTLVKFPSEEGSVPVQLLTKMMLVYGVDVFGIRRVWRWTNT